jgi:glutaminase
LVIPQYQAFSQSFKESYQEIKEDKENKYSWGEKAKYIPSLNEAEDDWFATAFCSSDGQFTQAGDYKILFSMQSISKIVAYAFLYNIYI